MSLPEFAELAGSKPFEAVFHSTAVRFGEEDLRVRARSERFDQRIAVRVPSRIEPMGHGEVVQDLVWKSGEGFARGGGRP